MLVHLVSWSCISSISTDNKTDNICLIGALRATMVLCINEGSQVRSLVYPVMKDLWPRLVTLGVSGMDTPVMGFFFFAKVVCLLIFWALEAG